MIFAELISTTVNTDNTSLKLTPEYINALYFAGLNSAKNDILLEINEYLLDNSIPLFQELQNLKFQYLQYKFNNSTKFQIWYNFFISFFWQKIDKVIDNSENMIEYKGNLKEISYVQLDILKEIIYYYCTILSSDEAYSNPAKTWEMLYSHVLYSTVWETIPFFENFENLRKYLASFFLMAKNSRATIEEATAKALNGIQENTDIYSGIISMESALTVNRIQQDKATSLLNMYLQDETHFELYSLYQSVKLLGDKMPTDVLQQKLEPLYKKIVKAILFERTFFSIYFDVCGSLIAVRTNHLWETSVDFTNIPETRMFHIYLADKFANYLSDDLERHIDSFLNQFIFNSTADIISALMNFNYFPPINDNLFNQWANEYFNTTLTKFQFDPKKELLYDEMISKISSLIVAKLNEKIVVQSSNNNFSDYQYTLSFISTLLKNTVFTDVNDLKETLKSSLSSYLLDLNEDDLNELSENITMITSDYFVEKTITPPITNPVEWQENITSFLTENVQPYSFEFGNPEHFDILDSINALQDTVYAYKEVNNDFINDVKTNALEETKNSLENMTSLILKESFFNISDNIGEILTLVENQLSPDEYNSLFNAIVFYLNGEINSDDLYTYVSSDIVDTIITEVENFKNEYINSFEIIKNEIVDELYSIVEEKVISQIETTKDSILEPFIQLEETMSQEIMNIKNETLLTELPSSEEETLQALTPMIQKQFELLELEAKVAQQVASAITDIVLSNLQSVLNDINVVNLCENTVINSQGKITSSISPKVSLQINTKKDASLSKAKASSLKEESVITNVKNDMLKIDTHKKKEDIVTVETKNLSKNLNLVKKTSYPKTIATPPTSNQIKQNPALNKKVYKQMASKKNGIDNFVSKLDDSNKKLNKSLSKFLTKNGLASFNKKLQGYGNSLVSLANMPAAFLNTMDKALSGFIDLVSAPFNIISNTFSGIVDGFKRAGAILGRMANRLKGVARKIISALCSFLGTDKIKDVLSSFKNGIGSGLMSLGKNLWGATKDKVSSGLKKIGSLFGLTDDSDKKMPIPKNKELDACQEQMFENRGI